MPWLLTCGRYAIATGKSYNYILQFAISLGQLYGTAAYFITSWLEGDNFAASPFYYYAYYIGANASWVVIPTLISIRCWKKICAAIQVEGQKKRKVRWVDFFWSPRFLKFQNSDYANCSFFWYSSFLKWCTYMDGIRNIDSRIAVSKIDIFLRAQLSKLLQISCAKIVLVNGLLRYQYFYKVDSLIVSNWCSWLHA